MAAALTPNARRVLAISVYRRKIKTSKVLVTAGTEKITMLEDFEKLLLTLKDSSLEVSANMSHCPEPGAASVDLLFSEGSKLRVDDWRLVRDGKAKRSSLDRQQQYGCPLPLMQ